MTSCMRAAMLAYDSPHDGRKGLYRYRQWAGLPSAPDPGPNVVPSNRFDGSISRSSTITSRPNSADSGAAVSSARSRGEDFSRTTSRPARKSAAALAIGRPSSESWKPGMRPERTPCGLYTSPCRSRWTTVVAADCAELPAPLSRGDASRERPGLFVMASSAYRGGAAARGAAQSQGPPPTSNTPSPSPATARASSPRPHDYAGALAQGQVPAYSKTDPPPVLALHCHLAASTGVRGSRGGHTAVTKSVTAL